MVGYYESIPGNGRPQGSPLRGGGDVTGDGGVRRRRSIRLQGYDYTRAGAYFITICAENRVCLFGDITNGEMVLNSFGEIASSRWHAIPERFRHVGVDEFVVMPNHIHGIMIIDAVGAPLAGALDIAGAGTRNSSNETYPPTPDDDAAETNNRTTGNDRATARVAPTVGDIVGGYKSICVYECLVWINNHDENRKLGKLWQRNYWEHIIRDEIELNRIREYIRNNPVQWREDRLNPRRGDPRGRPLPMVSEPVIAYASEGWMA
jgi:putative transposase